MREMFEFSSSQRRKVRVAMLAAKLTIRVQGLRLSSLSRVAKGDHGHGDTGRPLFIVRAIAISASAVRSTCSF